MKVRGGDGAGGESWAGRNRGGMQRQATVVARKGWQAP